MSAAGRILETIDRGALLLVGLERSDRTATVEAAARKIAEVRIFSDQDGKMNLDIRDAGGSFLAVSQFTLAASTSRGRRPSFDRAMAPDLARRLFDHFVETLRSHGPEVKTGRFGAAMEIELINEGPVTLIYDFE